MNLGEESVIVDHTQDIQHNISDHVKSTGHHEAGVFCNFFCKLHQFVHGDNFNKYKIT